MVDQAASEDPIFTVELQTPWGPLDVMADLAILPPEAGLPDLPSFAITLHTAPAARGPTRSELAQYLREAMARPPAAA